MGKGGSRFGAGRPGWRRTCEQAMALDIRQLIRRQLMTPGAYYSWKWSQGDNPVGSVSVSVTDERVVLGYQLRRDGPQGAPTTCCLPLTYAATGFGSRRLFCCPRCGRQCAVVYFGTGSFACRICLRLAYASEAEDSIGRLWRKQRKIERRLAAGAGDWNGMRPPRMHHATFERLSSALHRVEQEKNLDLENMVSRILGLMR